ncbi:MAG TPA: hypothetical protein VMU47_14230 [Caldimonas sp.]|nr:hypothetical protein [Caldimonas sp.]
MALISMGEWIDRYGEPDALSSDGDACRAAAPLVVVPLRHRRAVEPVHERLRSHARRGALRRAMRRRLLASARFA